MIKRLSETSGVSGFEKNVKKLIEEEICRYCDSVSTDSIGNLIAKKTYNQDFPNVVLVANMDEPGLIITDITDEGYLKFDIIGDVDVSALISQRVLINNITGIIALKAIHLSTKEEREKPLKTKDLFIDIGAKSKEDAKKNICIGDYCCFDTKFSEIGENYIKGKVLGERCSCNILINLLKSDQYKINLIAIFAVQSEVSARGTLIASRSIPNADFIFLLNSINVLNLGDDIIKCGDGVVINVVPQLSLQSEKICKIAENNRISYQKNINTNNKSLNSIIENIYNTPIEMISIPCKYKSTAVNMVNKNDINASEKLITEIIRRLGSCGKL